MNFKRITIELNGPICACDEQDLIWCPTLDSGGKHALSIECKTCKTKMIVGNSHFKAAFELDKPYPGKEKIEPKKREADVVDGCKILPFFAPIAEEP